MIDATNCREWFCASIICRRASSFKASAVVPSLCERAIANQIATLTLDGLRKVENVFEFSLPQSIQLELGMHTEEPSRVFVERAIPEWRIALHELRAIDGFKNKVRWVAENVFPNKAYVKQQMNQQSLLLAHGLRISRGIKRLFTR